MIKRELQRSYSAIYIQMPCRTCQQCSGWHFNWWFLSVPLELALKPHELLTVEWKWNAHAICCLFISRSLFFFSRCITQSVFRLLPLCLVCPAPSCLFGRANTFLAEDLPILHVESVGFRTKGCRSNKSLWLAVQLANQCMRSEMEVRDPNKLLRRQIWVLHFI